MPKCVSGAPGSVARDGGMPPARHRCSVCLPVVVAALSVRQCGVLPPPCWLRVSPRCSCWLCLCRDATAARPRARQIGATHQATHWQLLRVNDHHQPRPCVTRLPSRPSPVRSTSPCAFSVSVRVLVAVNNFPCKQERAQRRVQHCSTQCNMHLHAVTGMCVLARGRDVQPLFSSQDPVNSKVLLLSYPLAALC